MVGVDQNRLIHGTVASVREAHHHGALGQIGSGACSADSLQREAGLVSLRRGMQEGLGHEITPSRTAILVGSQIVAIGAVPIAF